MECIVCGNCNNFSKFLKAKRHHPTYWKCRECGFVFAYPQLQFNYKNFQFNPISDFELYSRLINYELRYDILREYVNKEKASLLDIGASTGIFLKLVKLKGIDGVGLEPNLQAALYGKRNFNIEILPVSLEKFKNEKKFDIITMFNVFEHVVDPVYTITKIKHILNRGGLFVLELPHIFTFQSLLSFGYWPHFERGHNWFFDKRTIMKFLNKHGFMTKNIMFIPKLMTFARIFDGLMTTFKIYNHMSRKEYLQFRKTKFYNYLNNKQIKVNMNDYLFIICQKN